MQQGRVAEATAELQAVVEINPNLADAQVLLGSVFDDRGEPEQAERHYLLALESRPAHPQANLMLAMHRIREGDLTAAEEYVGRLLQSETASMPILIYRLGVSYDEAGHTAKAVEHYGEARRLAEGSGRHRLLAEIDSRLEALN